MRSAPGGTVNGSPSTTSTRRPRVRSGRGGRPRSSGRPTLQIRWLPHRATGTTGTPVSCARAATPGISERTVKECDTPASGNAHTASPARSRRRARR